MNVSELAKKLELEQLSLPDGEKEVIGAYAGDLLSWVMSRAKSNSAWVTIMTNQNICAVATLTDVACIIIAEGAEISPDVVNLAKEKEVNLLRSPKTVYELCVALGDVLSK